MLTTDLGYEVILDAGFLSLVSLVPCDTDTGSPARSTG